MRLIMRDYGMLLECVCLFIMAGNGLECYNSCIIMLNLWT